MRSVFLSVCFTAAIIGLVTGTETFLGLKARFQGGIKIQNGVKLASARNAVWFGKMYALSVDSETVTA